jgi:tRNA (cytidine/uridine-2'-O-)-methyltransferase
MFHIVLVSPEIPPNTGNVIRLAANSGASLHLVRPLGFDLDDKKLKRAGLDYHEWATLQVHDTLPTALQAIGGDASRCFALTTKGAARIGEQRFLPGDVFVFGRETAGLSDEQMGLFPQAQRICLPMMPGQRSLNLSNAVAVTIYEAWRQAGYAGSVAL